MPGYGRRYPLNHMTKTWDVFISHASPDKDKFVVPLSNALLSRDVSVWLDAWEIELGSSISKSISEGLSQSRYGVVVLSQNYFDRPWPEKELATLLAKESDGGTHIVPIWLDVGFDDVMKHAPLMADKMAANHDDGFDSIADRICRLVRRDMLDNPAISAQDVEDLTLRLFPGLPINQYWQNQMLADLDTRIYRGIEDIELAVRRAEKAVHSFAEERPPLFQSGTDYVTKSLGFVDLCFRSRHNWAQATRDAFENHAHKINWEIKIGE